MSAMELERETEARLTFVVPGPTLERAPLVATRRSSALSFLGEISATAYAESLAGWRESR